MNRYLVLYLVTLIFGVIQASSAEEESNITCTDYGLYESDDSKLNISSIEGTWKANQLILHLKSEGEQVYNSCPEINITETPVTEKPRQFYGPSTESGLYHRTVLHTNWWREYRHLRLVWDEGNNIAEYSLYFKNDSVGFWNSHGDQNGTLPERRVYRQFTGTVQVLKAVGDHLLLHFCQAPTDGQQAQLFSVLLSREPRRLLKWEIESAHALLRRKNLSVTTRRLVCGNSAYRNALSAVSLLMAVLCSLLRFKSL